MIKIKDIIISDQYSTDFLYIKATVDDTTENINNYAFNLMRANTESFENSIMVAKDSEDWSYPSGLVFIDESVNLKNTMDSKYFYKIKITDKTTSKEEYSNTYGYKLREPDNVAAAIIYMNNIQLENAVNNPKLKLLRRKH
jgi:hypothetical protein